MTDPVVPESVRVVAVTFVRKNGPSANVMLVIVQAVSEVRVILRGLTDGCVMYRTSALCANFNWNNCAVV